MYQNWYTAEKIVLFTLTLLPPPPLKGGMFLSFPLLFSFRIFGNQPDKSLISVIDNICYVYPRARALCEKRGFNYEKFNVKSEKFNVILKLNYEKFNANGEKRLHFSS